MECEMGGEARPPPQRKQVSPLLQGCRLALQKAGLGVGIREQDCY